MASLPPGTVIIVAALLIPLLRGRLLQVWTIAIPVVSLVHLLWAFPAEHTASSSLFGQTLTFIRVDKLSLVWGYVFHLAAILASIYACHIRDRAQHFVAFVYVGASIGAVFAGDLLTLFLYWEITAVSSVFLIWSGQTRECFGAGMRYVLMHVGSGVLVLAGAVLIFMERGTLSFGEPGKIGMFHELASAGAWLLLLGFGIKAAFPLLHSWLPDSYPKSTATGTVYLSAFTTKMAIYALARGFAGCEPLIIVGAVMAIFPLFHALLADDLRQTLAHVLNNQLGFMVVGVGIGELAINGVAAQAFAHVIYKGLLFMAIGAVLTQVGSAKQSKLGGLARSMPWTCGFCLVGAFSMFPLNCGFVTKALLLKAVAEEHLDIVWLVLVGGAVGAFLAAGIKVPYFAFFSQNRLGSDRGEEAPLNMLIAMGGSATLCLLIGIIPSLLYRILPNPCDYQPYTLSHVVQQLQLLGFTGLAFVVALRLGVYPRPIQGTLLDFDWCYRRPVRPVLRLTSKLKGCDPLAALVRLVAGHSGFMTRQCSEAGLLGRSVSTNAMAISAVILLAIYLLIYY